jgi:PAS domain S-box-containing protein
MSTPLFNPGVEEPSSTVRPPSDREQTYVVHVYRNDEVLVDCLSRFVAGALAVGEPTVVIATREHQTALAERLAFNKVDASRANGSYIVLDARDVLRECETDGSVDEQCLQGLLEAALIRAREAGGDNKRRVAVFGEMAALLWEQGRTADVSRVGRVWNSMAQKHSFSLLRAYPQRLLDQHKSVEPYLNESGQDTGVGMGDSFAAGPNDEERIPSIAVLQRKTQTPQRKNTLQRSDEPFRLLVEAVQDYAIFMLDPNGIVSSWNVGAERMKGYKASEIVGSHFSRFYPEIDVLNGKPDWELVIASKEGRFEDEGWRVRKDGSRFWANVIITALRGPNGNLLGFAKVTRDFTERMQTHRALEKEVVERKEAQRQVHESERSLRALSLRLLHSQDEERRRLARELHDSVGQILAAMSMNLSVLRAEKLSPPAAKAIADNEELQAQAIVEIRTMSHLLHPALLDEAGLPSALQWYVDGFSERSNITVTLKITDDFGRMPDELEIAIFRIVQECLTNIHRHSGSPTAEVSLSRDSDHVKLEVRDEGTGLPLEKKLALTSSGMMGVGLRGMRERITQLNGVFEISSAEEGTVVRAIIPLAHRDDRESAQSVA